MSTTQADFTPVSEAEHGAAAHAVHQQRRRAEGDEMVESLSDRERLLIEMAWSAGAKTARDALVKKLASPHAVTLSAESVTRTVANWHDTPDLFVFDGWAKQHGMHYDERIVSLVRSAFKHAERADQGG